jgi:hypothetical protein
MTENSALKFENMSVVFINLKNLNLFRFLGSHDKNFMTNKFRFWALVAFDLTLDPLKYTFLSSVLNFWSMDRSHDL